MSTFIWISNPNILGDWSLLHEASTLDLAFLYATMQWHKMSYVMDKSLRKAQKNTEIALWSFLCMILIYLSSILNISENNRKSMKVFDLWREVLWKNSLTRNHGITVSFRLEQTSTTRRPLSHLPLSFHSLLPWNSYPSYKWIWDVVAFLN